MPTEEEKLTKDEAKKKRERESSGGGGAKFWPPHLKLSQPKKNIYLFQSFQVSFKIQIFNSNFHSQILNAQILNSNHKFSKIGASNFMIKIPRPNFQNFNAQNFEF